MTTTTVFELDLPVYDPEGLDRAQRLAALAEAQAQHWLARTPLGFSVTRYADVRTVFTDARFSRAVTLERDVPRVTAENFSGGLVAMDPPEHTRLRSL